MFILIKGFSKISHDFVLQSQIDDRDRTIRIQQNLLTTYETNAQTEVVPVQSTSSTTVETATQTERVCLIHFLLNLVLS